MLLRCISPNTIFIANLCSRLSTDVKLDERTKQQLTSSTLTDYEKNVVLLSWLNCASMEAFQAFQSALKDSQQEHLVKLLERHEGKSSMRLSFKCLT
jgi:hypothetical protein